MAKGDVTKKLISKWEKTMIHPNGSRVERAAQFVYKQELGKNKKGETIYSSMTKHERIS